MITHTKWPKGDLKTNKSIISLDSYNNKRGQVNDFLLDGKAPHLMLNVCMVRYGQKLFKIYRNLTNIECR